MDLFVNNTIIIELKAMKNIENIHSAIAKAYPRALNCKHGLFFIFNKEMLKIKRVIIKK